jgi:hypothetical protein
MFVIGAAALLLLFVGIHNAWDTVTHLVFVRKREEQRSSRTALVSMAIHKHSPSLY